MDYILNELSNPSGKMNVESGKKIMKDFVLVCRGLRQIGFAVLRIQNDLYSFSLSGEYCVYTWVSDRSVDRDLRRQFKSLLVNSPCLPDVEEEANEVFSLSDFYFKGTKATGLGVAYLLDTVAVSFKTHEDWLAANIIIDHHYLDDTCITESKRTVRNISDKGSLSVLKDWLETERIRRLRSGGELWENRGNLFGKLVFCPGVEDQLTNLSLSDSVLGNVVEPIEQN